MNLFMTTVFSQKTTLKFNNGKFRIVQFTDIHWLEEEKHKLENDSTLQLMRHIIEHEKPQLVVLTGDIVTYNKRNNNSDKAWRAVMQPMVDKQIPFVVTFGNHDTENEFDTKETLKLLKKIPYNLTYSVDENIAGVSNFYLQIFDEKGKKIKWNLLGLDSQANSQDTTIAKGYDWIRSNQIAWYKKNSEKSLKENKKNIPVIAFFHIPFPEFASKDKSRVLGNYGEDVASPEYNSGLFSTMKEMNNVVAVFVGHDHENDYIHVVDNICLGYGRKTGYMTAYDVETLKRGARIIDLYENEKKIDTYISTLTNKEFEFTFSKTGK